MSVLDFDWSLLLQRIPPRAGAWNVVGQRFRSPGRLESWAVVYYHGHVDEVTRFVMDLVTNLTRLGKLAVPLCSPRKLMKY